MKNKTSAALLLATGVMVGCVSINSERHEERMTAFKNLEKDVEYVDAALTTRYLDVRMAALRHIEDEAVLVKFVTNLDCSETVKRSIMSRLTDENCLAEIVFSEYGLEPYCLDAVKGIHSEKLLFDCAQASRFASVSAACVDRIKDEGLLSELALNGTLDQDVRLRALSRVVAQKQLGELALRAPEKWLLDMIVPRLTDSTMLKLLLQQNRLEPDTQLIVLERIDDEAFMLEYAKNTSHSEQLRKKALSRLSAASIAELSAQTAAVNDHAVQELPTVADAPATNEVAAVQSQAETTVEDHAEVMSRVNAEAMTRTHAETAMQIPAEKPAQTNEQATAASTQAEASAPSTQLRMEKETAEVLFATATDDLPAKTALPFLDDAYLKGDKSQQSAIRHFLRTSDVAFLRDLLLRIAEPNLELLAKKREQIKIAKVLAAYADESVLAMAENALFEPEVIQELAMGRYGNSEKAVLWAVHALMGEDQLVEIALRSMSAVGRQQAASMIVEEANAVKVALESHEAAVRLKTIGLLTKNSEDVLCELAKDEDATVRKAAVKQLEKIGSEKAEVLKLTVDVRN